MHENHASIVVLHRLKTFFKKSADTFASTQYLARIGILWNWDMFLVIPSGFSDFVARIKAFPLPYRYSSGGNLYESRFFPVLDTGWFQSFPGTVKSVRNTAFTIRCDPRSDPVGKTGDPSVVDWKASRCRLGLMDSEGQDHEPGSLTRFWDVNKNKKIFD